MFSCRMWNRCAEFGLQLSRFGVLLSGFTRSSYWRHALVLDSRFPHGKGPASALVPPPADYNVLSNSVSSSRLRVVVVHVMVTATHPATTVVCFPRTIKVD